MIAKDAKRARVPALPNAGDAQCLRRHFAKASDNERMAAIEERVASTQLHRLRSPGLRRSREAPASISATTSSRRKRSSRPSCTACGHEADGRLAERRGV